MDELKQRIFTLLEKYEKGLATGQDIRELETWYQTFEDRPDRMANLSDAEKLILRESMLKHLTGILSNRFKVLPISTKQSIILWSRWVVAASIVLFLSIGVYFLVNKPPSAQQASDVLKENFAPGSNKAVLTLAGGKQIILTDAKNGQLATQGGTVISKMSDGKVVYATGQSKKEVLMNSLSTPQGGQYALRLADGTGVWLNAASSIRYPSAFKGRQRQVEVTGEVYFEVATDKSKPFIVQCGAQTIEVTGTHFNVNAYENEGRVRTTLIEGAVVVSVAGIRQSLKPGQQAVLQAHALKVFTANTDEAVAWKEGYFQFEEADIQTVMRQISRWYDVEIIFEGPISQQTFTGRISRNRNISNVLKIVQSYKDVQLTFDERRIMVK